MSVNDYVSRGREVTDFLDRSLFSKIGCKLTRGAEIFQQIRVELTEILTCV